MEPINFKGANTLLQAAPEDKEAGRVVDMPVFFGNYQFPDGGVARCIISCWKPYAWEREQIANGEPVYIRFLHPPKNPPPVSIFVGSPFEPPPMILTLSSEDERERVDKEVRNLEVPRDVFDEIFLAVGKASKQDGDTDGMSNTGLDLAKFIGLKLEEAYRKGMADATDAAFQIAEEDARAQQDPDGAYVGGE